MIAKLASFDKLIVSWSKKIFDEKKHVGKIRLYDIIKLLRKNMQIALKIARGYS